MTDAARLVTMESELQQARLDLAREKSVHALLTIAADIAVQVLSKDRAKWGDRMRADHLYALLALSNAIDGEGPPCRDCLQKKGAGKVVVGDEERPCVACEEYAREQDGDRKDHEERERSES